MSFRARLTVLFVVIVIVPMAAVGFLVFRLIDDSQSGKAAAVANETAQAAYNVYERSSRQASLAARGLARQLALAPTAELRGRTATLASEEGDVRVTVRVGRASPISVGSPAAVAPGVAIMAGSGAQPSRTVSVSQLSAVQYARELSGSDNQVAVRVGRSTVASTLPAARAVTLPPRGNVTIGSSTYRVITQTLAGYGGQDVHVSILSNLSAPGESASTDRILAAIFIGGFLLLAFCFSLLSARALQGQISRFLQAAHRLAGGDFSSPVPTVGNDEFAQLGEEFNVMSRELERRLEELEQERARIRQGIRRIGEAFASGLDRTALLELALQTAMDATGAERGRISARSTAGEPLAEMLHVGRLSDIEDTVYEAERRALTEGGLGEAATGDLKLASVALGPVRPAGPTYGLITVCRSGPAFTEDDWELLRSLASQATLAIANVALHYDIQRQAVTDDLTGLATHGHFQKLLSDEMEEVRRYDYPVGLIMLDIDNFKTFNDEHGHQQGDRVLRAVADVLCETSRDVDIAARYGGEEMALILPHTDADGTYEMAERVRTAIEALRIPLIDGEGTLRITASVGSAASSDADKNDLIAAADSALYVAKHEGKNRTVRADSHPANVGGGE